MKLNKAELKKAIHDFNSISNRLLRANHQDYYGILKKFLVFIHECDIIREYIDDCGKPSFDVDTEFKEVANSNGGAIFDLGETNKAEIANIFGIILYVIENKINMTHTIGYSYSSSNKFQDMIKAINERLVLIFIRHIESHLVKIGIDMGLDETTKYNISVTNGQVNVANDNAIINATINNGIEQEQLLKLINDVRKVVPLELSSDDTASIKGSLELIETELKQDKPRKNIVQSAITALKAIKSTTEFSASVATLLQFVSNTL
jgi:hypothetical protein